MEFQLISSKNISSINFLFHIIQAVIKAVCNNCLALCFECIEVIDHLASKECCTIFKGWFVDNNFCTFCLDTFHDALNSRLTEVITV